MKRQNLMLFDAVRRADKILSSARENIISKWREAGWLGPYYLLHRLYIPDPMNFKVVDDLPGEYLVIGDDEKMVYLLDPVNDLVYATKYEYFPRVPYTVYIWQDGLIEGVDVSYETYQKYGNARFIPFIWVQVIRDLLLERDPSYIVRRLPTIRVDMWKMKDLASKYRRGKEKRKAEDIFREYPTITEQHIKIGRFMDGVYMVLAVDVKGYTVRMLYDQVLPSELSHWRGFYEILEINEPFFIRGGWDPLMHEVDFWEFLSENRPVLIVRDQMWGAFFNVIDYPYYLRKSGDGAVGIVHFPDPSGNFWRVIRSKDHQTWYIPRKYWDAILDTIQFS